MPVKFNKSPPADAVQSIAQPLTRQQLIDALLEDRFEPSYKIKPVMENYLLKGFVGFQNMTDEQLLAMWKEDHEPAPEISANILPAEPKTP